MRTRKKLSWIALLYFAEGLPFGLVKDVLPVYFRVHGVSLRDIGLTNLLMSPWAGKFLWSPLVDQVGERRQWIAAALVVMAAALLVAQGLPAAPVALALMVVLLIFTLAAATQDIAIDAYTIEMLAPGEEGPANGVRVAAYRVALIIAGGVLVALAGRAGWGSAFGAAAALFALLAAVILLLPRLPRRELNAAQWLRTFRAWLARPGAIAVFFFILLYKVGDTAMGPMVRPFWVDRGLTLDDIAFVTAAFGVGATIAGALLGGAFTSRIGIFHALWILGLLQALSNLGYAGAAWAEAGRPGIYAASLLESFTGGLGTAAFLSFLMNVCDKEQAATQYALLSAIFNLSGTLVGSVSGHGAEQLGYAPYFALTFLLALPAYAFLPWVRRWIRERPVEATPGD